MSFTPSSHSRRGVLRLAGAAGALASLPLGVIAALADQAPGELRFSGLSVDTSGLAERGLSNYAVRIAKEAQPILDRVFADRRASGGAGAPRLVLKIDQIQLASDVGAAAGFGAGPDSESDYITGAGQVVDGRGHVIATKPIDASAAPIGGPGPDILYLEKVRTERLIEVLAEWVKQAV